MEENAIIKFFREIHLSAVDAKYLASQALNASWKSVFLFFIAVFFISLTISSISRTARITKFAPELLSAAVGILKFDNYKLTSPDTLISVDGWKLKEIGTLITGVKLPKSAAYPIAVTVGTDSIASAKTPFIHVGENAFSTNILSIFLRRNPDRIQNISWSEILPAANPLVDANYYKTQFSKISNKFKIFVAGFVIIGVGMFEAILHIWVSLLIYLLFFGQKLNFSGRHRLIMLATTPYFILMPVSLTAAKSFDFTTDIALICALIMTIRAVPNLDLISVKENGNEKK